MYFTRSTDPATGFAKLHLRTQTQQEEDWRHAMRAGPGQKIAYHDLNGTDFELVLENIPLEAGTPHTPDGKVGTPSLPGTPGTPTPGTGPGAYHDLTPAQLETRIIERGLPEPARGAKRGDLLRTLQDADARKAKV